MPAHLTRLQSASVFAGPSRDAAALVETPHIPTGLITQIRVRAKATLLPVEDPRNEKAGRRSRSAPPIADDAVAFTR
jgi:hypothetical protein